MEFVHLAAHELHRPFLKEGAFAGGLAAAQNQGL